MDRAFIDGLSRTPVAVQILGLDTDIYFFFYSDCGLFYVSFVEYFVTGKPIMQNTFNVEMHCHRLASLLFWQEMRKQKENLESDDVNPVKLKNVVV